jgi:hypothetical protein
MKPEVIIHVMWALGALAIVNFLYQMIKKRGFKGVIFGARIAQTVGELDLGKSGPTRTILKLHRLESREPGAATVGIEVVVRTIASYHMWPIRLTAEQAAVLRELLSQAAASG